MVTKRIIDSDLQNLDVTVDMDNASEVPGWKVDGAIVLQSATPAAMQELELGSIPYVVVNGSAGGNGCSVVPDDIAGPRLAMRYFLELGHTRITYAGPLPTLSESHSSVADRNNTYLHEMKENNASPILGPNEILYSANVLIHFLKSKSLPNGIGGFPF
jgi:DNA-binding LacI/PurR family transcriptional regulator